MNRTVSHTTRIGREYLAVCDWMSVHGAEVLAQATSTAGSTADRMVLKAKVELPFFRVDEEVALFASPLWQESADRAAMILDWSADRRHRILPNVEARLLIDNVIPRGVNATTALSVVGSFNPPSGFVRRMEQAVFTRRVLDLIIETFVDSVAEVLLTELPPQTPESASRRAA